MTETDLPRSMQAPVRWAALGLRLAARLVFWTQLVRLRVRGRRNIPKRGGAILVGNHPSSMDAPFLYLALWRRVFAVFAGRAAFNRRLVGRYATWSGQLKVSIPGDEDEDSHAEAVKAIREARRILLQGGLVLIHAEGGYEYDPETLKMFPSDLVAYLAYSTGTPVIPVATRGSERYLPGYEGPWYHRWWCPFTSKVKLAIGKPLWPIGDNMPVNRQRFMFMTAGALLTLTGQQPAESWFYFREEPSPEMAEAPEELGLTERIAG